MTMSLHQDPHGTQQTRLFECHEARDPPQKSEGIGGVFRMGLRERVPLTGGGRRPRS
ncbi:hypothetical protein PMEGAPL125_53510 [Priestia megaterium]